VQFFRSFAPELDSHVSAWPRTGRIRGLVVTPWPEDMRDDPWLPYVNDDGFMTQDLQFRRDADLLHALAHVLRRRGQVPWIRLVRTREPMGGYPPHWAARMRRRRRQLVAALDHVRVPHPQIIV